jgi:hypothetical protein
MYIHVEYPIKIKHIVKRNVKLKMRVIFALRIGNFKIFYLLFIYLEIYQLFKDILRVKSLIFFIGLIYLFHELTMAIFKFYLPLVPKICSI